MSSAMPTALQMSVSAPHASVPSGMSMSSIAPAAALSWRRGQGEIVGRVTVHLDRELRLRRKGGEEVHGRAADAAGEEGDAHGWRRSANDGNP